PLTIAGIYGLVGRLGVSLLQIAFFLPPTSAIPSIILLYFLGRQLEGGKTGLLAALLGALCPIYVNHTAAGFLESSILGIPLLLLVSLLFLKALKTASRIRALTYSAAAGVSLAYLNISWEFCYYAGFLLASLVFAVVLLQGYTPRLAASYLLTVFLGILLALPFPTPGLHIIASLPALPTLLAAILVCSLESLHRLLPASRRRLQLAFSLTLTAVGGLALYYSGLTSALTYESLEVLNPAVRPSTLLGILREASLDYKTGTWASSYIALGGILPLGVLGLLLASRKVRPETLYTMLFALTSLYALASMVRLSLLAAPALSLLAAYALLEISKTAGRVLKQGWKPPISKLAILTPILIIILLFPTFLAAVDSADFPPPIAASALPSKTPKPDWLEALAWIRENLEGKPVVAWWSHGYWLGVLGKAATVSDPSLLDSRKTAEVAILFLSKEDEAAEILKGRFQAEYLLAFITTFKHPQVSGYHVPLGFGDDGSWMWMARAASQLKPGFTMENLDKNGDGIPDEDTLLGKIIFYAMGVADEEVFERFEIAYVSPSHGEVPEASETAQIIILKVKD
ncbi:MAG: hypothetical protein DRO52_03475, partial [Candidatus Hecatellales archaeon]